MYLKWGTVGEGEKEMGSRVGGEGLYTVNQGSEWTGVAPRQRRDFQVSKMGSKE